MLDLQKIKTSLFLCLFFPASATNLHASEVNFQSKNNLSNRQNTSFVTPSKNIYCALIGEDQNILRCEIRSMLKPLPPQPYSNYCEFDWGAGLLLRQHGKPEILCISDTISSTNYILSYENTWNNLGFKCVSKRTGLTCTNPDGHGFFLSRNSWSAF